MLCSLHLGSIEQVTTPCGNNKFSGGVVQLV
jgi:hypothetical protein